MLASTLARIMLRHTVESGIKCLVLFNSGLKACIPITLLLAGLQVLAAQEADDALMSGPPTLSALSYKEPLTMKAVVAMALRNNGDIKTTDLGKLIQQERIKSAMLDFDLHVDASYLYQFIDSPQNAQDYVSTGGGTASPFNPAQPILTEPTIFEQRNHIGKFGVTQKLETGTVVEFGTTLRDLDNSLNRRRPPAVYHTEWETFTGVTVTHPLLRDSGRTVNTAKITIAKANAKSADLEWQLRTTQVVAEVMKRYYDVVFTIENLKVQHESIALGQKLLADTRARSKEGQVAANEVAIAEAGVYRRMEDSLAAEMQYIERQNALQMLYQTPEDVIAGSTRVIPVDRLFTSVPRTHRPTLIQAALGKRQEIKQMDQLLVAKNAELDYTASQSRPRLDLVASAGLHGLEGDAGSSYSKAASMQGPEWSAGIQFSKPWNRDNLEAQKRAAKHERTQAMIKSGDMRIRIALEVDTVMSRLQADQQRLTATRKSREAAAQSADAGLKRLNEGVATSFEVLQLQREFSQARSREIAALTDLNKNIVDLQMATGTLLDEQGVNLVPDFSSASEVGGPEPVVNIPASEKSVSRASRVRKPGARKLP